MQITQVEYVGAKERRQLTFTSFDVDGDKIDRGRDAVISPGRSALCTVSFSGELPITIERYDFIVTATDDGTPRLINATVSRARREPRRR